MGYLFSAMPNHQKMTTLLLNRKLRYPSDEGMYGQRVVSVEQLGLELPYLGPRTVLKCHRDPLVCVNI
jgi:hypothetical protein